MCVKAEPTDEEREAQRSSKRPRVEPLDFSEHEVRVPPRRKRVNCITGGATSSTSGHRATVPDTTQPYSRRSSVTVDAEHNPALLGPDLSIPVDRDSHQSEVGVVTAATGSGAGHLHTPIQPVTRTHGLGDEKAQAAAHADSQPLTLGEYLFPYLFL